MTDTIESNRDWRHHWSSVGQRIGKDDFLRQVERTAAGQAMDGVQLELPVEAIRIGLDLRPSDTLLDLCCGNGLVTIRLAKYCRQVMGLDFSSDLIEVARRHHGADNVIYLHGSATEVSPTSLGTARPSKIVMCAALQYFSEQGLGELMRAIHALGPTPVPVYFTDVPDVDHLYDLYDTPDRRAEFDHRRAAGTEAVGTWWSRQRLHEILRPFGYLAEFKAQDPRRFTAHYRFDLLAKPIEAKP